MRRIICALAAVGMAAMLAVQPASAVTVDTSTETVEGSVNARAVVAQAFAVDAGTPVFSSLSVWFDPAAAGRTVGVRLTDALSGGATFFSTSVVAAAGRVDIAIDALLAPGTVYALLDFGAYRGRTLQFVGDVYVGGAVYERNNGGRWVFKGDRDLRMTAEFLPNVPVPAALPLMLTALGALGLASLRRRRG